MPDISAEQLNLLTQATELQAGGASWKSIATQLKVSEDLCRAWPDEYPDAWRRLYRRAAAQHVRDALAEARTFARKFLRSENEKTALAAAQILLKLSTARARRKSAISVEDQEMIAEINQLKALTDDQVNQMVCEIVAESKGAERTEIQESPPESE